MSLMLALIKERLDRMTEPQLELVDRIVSALVAPCAHTTDDESDFATQQFAEVFGQRLRLHHVMSTERFTKDKFEHALLDTFEKLGVKAELAPRGNPGHDITVDGERWSLKTQANASIKPDRIWISKFMELGKGDWLTEDDLYDLRNRMFQHMEGYERIFALRCLTPGRTVEEISYELVEIPKALLLRAKLFPCTMKQSSRQSPKPGECKVTSEAGPELFTLYFDGGTERKLQVKHLSKEECRVHATWTLSSTL